MYSFLFELYHTNVSIDLRFNKVTFLNNKLLQVWTTGSWLMNRWIRWPLYNQFWPAKTCCPSPNLLIGCLCLVVEEQQSPPVQSTQYGCRSYSGKETPSYLRDPHRAIKTTSTRTTPAPNTWTGWSLLTLSTSWTASPSHLMQPNM